MNEQELELRHNAGSALLGIAQHITNEPKLFKRHDLEDFAHAVVNYLAAPAGANEVWLNIRDEMSELRKTIDLRRGGWIGKIQTYPTRKPSTIGD